MIIANDLFREGRLEAAIAQQTEEVKNKPADVTARIFLFELLCFAGNYERA
jgi:type VI secretion system protein ImpE